MSTHQSRAQQNRRVVRKRFVCAMIAWIFLPIAGGAQTIPISEYAERRARILRALPDGILLLHARSTPKAMEQWGWVQDASFFYFSGFANLPSAILALDGPRGEARLFVPPAPLSFGVPVHEVIPATGAESAQKHRLTAIEPWQQFRPYIEKRIAEGTKRIYLDGARRPEATGVPDGMWPVAGEKTLWRYSVQQAFPEAEIVSAVEKIRQLRWVKSATEIAILRANAEKTAQALLAGIRRIAPGVSQRQAEAAVVAACLENGGEGPSFWPWLMSGANTEMRRLVRSFYDYSHLNRTMQAGELVRVDIGCAGGFYGGDVGRTVPVSGQFSNEQRDIWNLLVAAYHAGLQAVRPGVSRKEIYAASTAEIVRRNATMQTAVGKKAAAQMLDAESGVRWHLHGIGVESGEEALEILQEGTVFAFEPGFAFGGDAYYLEDMVVVTKTGREILSTGLPYTANEIEAAMAK